MREIKGKYGKMKLILQIWKDNGLIKANRLICDCKHEKNDVEVLQMRKYLFRKILNKRCKCGNLIMNHCKLILSYELGIMNEKWGLHKLSEEPTSGNGETVESKTYEKYIMGMRKSRNIFGGITTNMGEENTKSSILY